MFFINFMGFFFLFQFSAAKVFQPFFGQQSQRPILPAAGSDDKLRMLALISGLS